MIAHKIWHAFNQPPRHDPLFAYIVTQRRNTNLGVSSSFFMWLFIVTGLGFCWTVTFDWLPTLVLLALIFANTTYSALWSLSICRTIVSEQAQRRYDVLATLPLGRFGTSWAMGMGTLHRRRSFTWIPFLVRLFSMVLMITLVGALAITGLALQNTETTRLSYESNFAAIPLVIAAMGVVVVFYFDHLYSVVIGILLGMIAPIDVRNTTEATLRAFGAFMVTQMVTYTLGWFVVLVFLPQILQGVDRIPATLVQVVAGLLLYALLREITLRYLWRYLRRQLNAGRIEIDHVMMS